MNSQYARQILFFSVANAATTTRNRTALLGAETARYRRSKAKEAKPLTKFILVKDTSIVA